MANQLQIETVLLPAYKYRKAVTITKPDGQKYSGYMLHDLDHDGFSLSSGTYCFWSDIIEVEFCKETLALVEPDMPTDNPFL